MYLVYNGSSYIHNIHFSGEGEVTAVDNVSLDIEEGELVTLLGPSVCGKTTNLRMIAGFEFPTSGEIYLDGKTVNDLPPHKRDMSMVFQSYAIFPHLSVYENVAYGLKVQRLPKKEVEERVATTLDLVELGGYENHTPHQLSGGQQQRVALARALIMEPKVLLMDVDFLGHAMSAPAAEAHYAIGTEVTVVRPEMMIINPPEAHVQGVVGQATYLVNVTEYDVEVEGQLLAIVESDPRHITIHQPGEAVQISFLEDCLYVLPA